MEVLIGCDPEVFVTKGGLLTSAHGLVKGTKKAPYKVVGGAVQVDGMALELNTDPTSCIIEFQQRVELVLGQLAEMVPDYRLSIQPTADFDPEYLASLPFEATELGCDPDYNAYTGKVNPTPDKEVSFRTGAGHIHLGWTEDVDPFDPGHFEACCLLAQQLDCYLGLPSLLWDKDNRRRELYGQAGAFRPKTYGMEYRVLSNSWLRDPKLIKFVFARAVLAFRELLFNGVVDSFNGISCNNFPKIMNSNMLGVVERNTSDGWLAHV